VKAKDQSTTVVRWFADLTDSKVASVGGNIASRAEETDPQ
jgi:hypothetical protein